MPFMLMKHCEANLNEKELGDNRAIEQIEQIEPIKQIEQSNKSSKSSKSNESNKSSLSSRQANSSRFGAMKSFSQVQLIETVVC